MNIDLTREEYRHLLDILSMSDWVMHAHKAEKDRRTAPYDSLTQKLYSYARAMGYEDLVEHDPHAGDYYLTSRFEENSRSWTFIDEFTDGSFWDELSHRMTERDAARRAGGEEKLRSMSREERSALEGPIQERYDDEFYENGIDRLEIVEHFGLGANRATITHD